MKLYAFRPRGHGELSFYVMETSERGARLMVSEYIKRKLNGDDEMYAHYANGWGTDYYEMEVYEQGFVAINSND